MIVLGVVDTHNASASIMVDGRVVAAAQEERFTKNKIEVGFPAHAIEYCLRAAGVTGRDVDLIGISTANFNPDQALIRREATFSIRDYITEQHEYWGPKLYEGSDVRYVDVYKDRVDLTQKSLAGFRGDYRTLTPAAFFELRKQAIADFLGVPLERVVHVPHHRAHAFYAYFGSFFRGERVLALTADGWGDGANGTVGVFEGDEYRCLAESTGHELARMYRYVTLLLGMRPLEHEYKVMGLAAYTTPYHWQPVLHKLEKSLRVNGLRVEIAEKGKDWYFYLRDLLEGSRFDAIAGGAQKLVEVMLIDWVKNAIAASGSRKVVFSGGLAMNVKANLELGEIEEVQDLYICPSGSDESLAIGMCYFLTRRLAQERKSPLVPSPMDNIYTGPSYDGAAVRSAVAKRQVPFGHDVVEGVDNARIVEWMTSAKVVGLFRGRMEFGARALGNRSIIADPRDGRMIKIINDQIKKRDFWMPFTPSILGERAGDYMENPKGLFAPFMTMAFRSTPKARAELVATLHPADFSMRPQQLRREFNPAYHDLIRRFEAATGVGGILNTSLNLHGLPMACSPEDALRVFAESDLDVLVVEDIALCRRST